MGDNAQRESWGGLIIVTRIFIMNWSHHVLSLCCDSNKVPTVTFKELTSDFQFILIFFNSADTLHWPTVEGCVWRHNTWCELPGWWGWDACRCEASGASTADISVGAQHRCWTNLRISLNISLFCFKRLVTMVRSMQVFNAVIFHWACWYRSSCVSFNARLW